MKTSLFALLTLSLFTLAAHAESPDEALRQQIRETLSMRPSSVTNTGWWLSLPPQTPTLLMAMFRTSDHNYERTKLVEALANFKDQASLSFLKQQATAGIAAAPVRYAAIRSVGRSAGMQESEFLSGLLKDSDVHARVTAAETLQRLSDPAAAKLVRDYLAQEQTPWIVARLKRNETRRNASQIIVKHQ